MAGRRLTADFVQDNAHEWNVKSVEANRSGWCSSGSVHLTQVRHKVSLFYDSVVS